MALPNYEIEEYIKKADKCKLEWKLSKIQNDTKEKDDDCFKNVKYIINKGLLNYSFKTMEATWNCSIDTFYYLSDKNDKIWDSVYILADKTNYRILKIDKKNYDKYSEVPLCEDNIVELPQENYLTNKFVWWGIIILLAIIWVIFYKFKKTKKQSK